jgi:hypothetical protein
VKAMMAPCTKRVLETAGKGHFARDAAERLR